MQTLTLLLLFAVLAVLVVLLVLSRRKGTRGFASPARAGFALIGVDYSVVGENSRWFSKRLIDRKRWRL